MSVHGRIVTLLDDAGVRYRILEHPPVRTAAEAARVRGTPLGMGAKAIVFKADGAFRLFVLPGARELSSRRIRRGLGVSRTRFASRAELAALTGLEPGCVPPFGEPILPLELIADPRLVELEEIAFTAGRHDRSIVMGAADWRRVAGPRLVPCSR
jgi:Ala-tRNA(Pro) deacylase